MGEGEGASERHITEETTLIIQVNDRLQMTSLTFPLSCYFKHKNGLLILR